MNFDDLVQLTGQFFERHWDKAENVELPVWKNNWGWQSSVPYHNKGGVYALIDKDEAVIYVGLGVSRGNQLYKEHGISRRLLSHVIATDKSKGRGYYTPKQKWTEVIDIAAIGFPKEFCYLAPALEHFLIERISPVRNRTLAANSD
tara:strand:+ start:473 stop:910 length:438 start_codon:yes stop_codon:yes gene_type:complete